MPNIREYDSTSSLTPSDKGINAAEQAARHYARVGNEIGRDIGGAIHKIGDRVERHMAIMETSELYKTGTELKLNLQKRYEEESALPENRNDPHFGDKFMAEVAPMLDEWGKHAQTEHGKMLAVTLKSGIRNEIFGHVAAGQSEMDAAHVDDNLTQTGNMLGSGLITDPSEINLTRTIGTMKDTIQGMTAGIPDVRTREQVASEMTHRFVPQLVATRYQGVAESIKNQIAETGGETSPALEQLNKDVAAQLGFQYISPETQTRITKLGDEAVSQGQALFNSRHATAKAQAVEAGKARYAEIHSVATTLAMNGQGPTPDLVEAVQDYAQKFGATNPGEAASLDDFILRGQDRAQKNTVQPYNQQTRDSIQAGFSRPSGDPKRPTLASLMRDYSHGLITQQDLTGYTEILSKLDKPDTDPKFKPAWDNFTRWQNQMVQSIGTNDLPGTSAARAQFLHDSTAAFMTRGRSEGDWDKTLDTLTNAQNPHSFGHSIGFYKKAAMKPDAANWLRQHDQFDPRGLPAYGSTPAPVYPTKKTGAPAPIKPAADLQKADEIIWGKK